MKNNVLSILSLVFGILSCVTAMYELYVPIIVIGAIFGLVAIIFHLLIKKENRLKKDFAGFVLGICGIFAAGIWLYLYLV